MTAEDLDTVVTLFKGLADPTRLRMVAAMVDRARCGQDLASEIGVAPATISHHLKVLGKAGLLIETRQPPYVFYKVDLEAVQRAVRAVATPKRVRELTTAPPVDDDTQKVLRTFFDGPRLRALPVQRRKKELVLEEVLRRIRAGASTRGRPQRVHRGRVRRLLHRAARVDHGRLHDPRGARLPAGRARPGGRQRLIRAVSARARAARARRRPAAD